jgi:hypothetical protein
VENLTNYVIGHGFAYRAVSRRPGDDKELASRVQAVIDDFLESNSWVGDLDRELFQRKMIDGEYFVGLWHDGGGRCVTRAIEPDSVTEPIDARAIEQYMGLPYGQSSWSFGVHTDADDVETVHGYWCKWSHREDDWDYLPGGPEPIEGGGQDAFIEHSKANVTRNVKRGLTDFFATRESLERARKVLRNVGEGAAVQAAIAFFREHVAGTSSSGIANWIKDNAARSYQRQGVSGNRTAYSQHFDAGTIVDHGANVQYKYGPLGQNNAPVYLEVFAAMLRSVAVRWQMPEHMISGDASNNNYSSILVAESPFVRAAEARQQSCVRSHLRILRRVVWFAWRAGRFGDIAWPELLLRVRLEAEPPGVAVRDPDKENNRWKLLVDGGAMAVSTWAAKMGLDHEQELAKGASRASVTTPMDGSKTDAAVAAQGGGESQDEAKDEKQATESEREVGLWRRMRHLLAWKGYP